MPKANTPPTRPSNRFSSVMKYQLSKEKSCVRDLELAKGFHRLQKVSSEADETSKRTGNGLVGTTGESSAGGWASAVRSGGGWASWDGGVGSGVSGRSSVGWGGSGVGGGSRTRMC